MKALIQKDLRENLKLALIGLLIFSLILLQAYRSCMGILTNLLVRGWSGEAVVLQPLLSPPLLTQAAFFCAIFGAALGWLQTRNEAHRDLWAFLVHRPVTRTEIFWGKTIAGLCLYVFGAGLPLAVLVAVVRTPGHVAAPFEWAMVLPTFSIFLAGLGFYFAGFLTGLRQARWYASRSLGLGLAIITTLGLFGLPRFGMSLDLIAIAILATAAWGACQSGGFYRGQPVAGRLALTVAMTMGCGLVLGVGVNLLLTLVLDPLSPHQPFVYSNYLMTRDGSIYQETFQDGEMVEFADLDGHPVLDPKTGRKMEGKEFQKRFTYGGSVFTRFEHRNRNRIPIQDASGAFNLINVTDKTLWYLDRHGKLTGYDGRTRKYIGSLDPHGFDGTLASEPFLSEPNSYSYYNSYNDEPRKLLATVKTVYQVDFKDRTVKPVFTLTNGDEIGGHTGAQADYDNNQVRDYLLTTRRIVYLLDEQGQPIFTLPYQPAYFEYPQVEISFLQPTNSSMNNFAVWFYPDYRTNEAAGWKMPVHVLWLGPGQTVTKSADLPTLREPEGNNSWREEMAASLVPLPLFVAITVAAGGKIYSVWYLLSFAQAFICAAIAWSLARRYNFSTLAVLGWTLYVILVGISGLLALLCVQEWAAREFCPNCKKLRTVDREFCEHCESPFSPPEKNGTEIFAPLIKV